MLVSNLRIKVLGFGLCNANMTIPNFLYILLHVLQGRPQKWLHGIDSFCEVEDHDDFKIT